MGFGNKTLVLGVTGVIGSGKSALCKFLEKKHGFHWIEADAVVRDLYKIGQPAYQKIKEYFGAQFVGKAEVCRGRLRRLVLKNPQKLWILNKLIHPLVAHEVNKKIVQLKRGHKGSKPLRICIEAVYFEPKDLGKFVDRMIVVDASDSQILKRLKKRKITENNLRALLAFQRKNLWTWKTSPNCINIVGNAHSAYDRIIKQCQTLSLS